MTHTTFFCPAVLFSKLASQMSFLNLNRVISAVHDKRDKNVREEALGAPKTLVMGFISLTGFNKLSGGKQQQQCP